MDRHDGLTMQERERAEQERYDFETLARFQEMSTRLWTAALLTEVGYAKITELRNKMETAVPELLSKEGF